MAHKSGGANAWSVLAADPERDLVFVPTGSAAPDYYGGAAPRRQPLRELDRRAEGVDRPRGVGVPDRPPRPLGLRQRVAAGAGHAHARRRARPRRAPGEQERDAVRAQPRDRPCRSFPSRSAPCPPSDIPIGTGVADATVHRRDAAAQPASIHGRRGVGHDRRRSRRVPRRHRGTAQRRASSRRRACRARS